MIQGIDLSHNNESFNWGSLSPNIKFVFLKATQGAGFKDPMFQTYWKYAKAANKLHGAYHFLTFENATAQEQADNFLSRGVDFSLPGVLPPVVDIEDQVPATLNKYILDNKQKCIDLISEFLSIVHQKTAVKPIIYSYKNFFAEYLNGHVWDADLWLAAIQSTPPSLPPGYKNFLFWQNSWKGKITGELSGGALDMDLFNGTMEQLNALANIK